MSKVTAVQVAVDKLDNPKGSIEELSGLMEFLKIAIGTPLIPVIELFTNVATAMASEIVAALHNVNFVTSFDKSNSSITGLVRAITTGN